MDSAFLCALLTACSLFRLQLSFKCIDFFEVQNILVLSAGSFKVIRLSISRMAINDLILSSGNPSLKIASCSEYLESGFSESTRHSSLIHSDLSVSGPSTLPIFFTLETKGMGGSHAKKEARQRRIWKTSVITVLYIERTISISSILDYIWN
jgi:hypothetical protein